MRYLLLFAMTLGHHLVYAQFRDDFSDSNFTVNPVWSGDTLLYEISPDHRLHLNAGSTSGPAYLSTPSRSIMNGLWEVRIDMDFNPSSSNYVKIYLVSTAPTLTASLNGYFVKAGGSEDEVSLYYEDGFTETRIIDGKDKRIDVSSVNARIRVSRDSTGLWELFIDSAGTAVFIKEGEVRHDLLLKSNFSGIVCDYTSTRADKFHFDNFQVSGAVFSDTISPFVTSVALIAAETLEITFSEPLDSLMAANPLNYKVDQGIGNPAQIIPDSSYSSLRLHFSSEFPPNVPMTLSIYELTDTAGNTAALTNILFERTVYADGEFLDITINEVYADPTPPLGLPEKEYLELYNRSNKRLLLSGWKLYDIIDTAILPVAVMDPGSYLILCAIADTLIFNKYGKTLGLAGFPGLNNAEDQLWLTGSSGKIIDYLHYSDDWYGNGKLPEGGISLEKEDPFYNCSGMSNWKASTDVSGGTPGRKNSLQSKINDGTGPKITGIIALGDSSLLIYLNKPMDTSYQHLRAKINANEVAGTFIYSERTDEIRLKLQEPLLPGDEFNLTLYDLKDCFGNSTAETRHDFIVPAPGAWNDLVINEILFNPRIGGSDFAELYNRSLQHVDLYGWYIAGYDHLSDSIDDIRPITEDHFLIPPGNYITLTADSSSIIFEYPANRSRSFIEQKLPAFGNESGSCILLNNHMEIIDRFDYEASMHFQLLSDVKGVSLERIQYDRAASDRTNWHSAAQNAGFATPGYLNSQFREEISQIRRYLKSDPEIFSPDNDGYNDVLNIGYEVEKAGYTGYLGIYDLTGREIIVLYNNTLLSTSGTITWDGIDGRGEKAPTGIYLIYFRAFHTSGKVITDKLPCVLGHKLNK